MAAEKIDYEKYPLKKYKFWTVYLHYNQAYLGRTYIALNRAGSLDAYSDTTPEERKELETIILKLQKVLNNLYSPDIYNYATFGNTWLRCHWHMIPRYRNVREIDGQEFTDENWGKNYAPYNRSFEINNGIFERINKDITDGLKN